MNTAKVLWFNEADGNGIIEDFEGNEYFVPYNKSFHKILEPGQVVEFKRNRDIENVYCAEITKVLS